jgi:hypothetical protein
MQLNYVNPRLHLENKENIIFVLEFKDLFSRDEKLNQTAYLADMSGLLNQLNVSLQGHNLSITDSWDKVVFR